MQEAVLVDEPLVHDDPKNFNRPILTMEQAAEFLQISPRKLYDEVKSRRIPHIKLGRRILFRREAIEGALKRLEVGMVC